MKILGACGRSTLLAFGTACADQAMAWAAVRLSVQGRTSSFTFPGSIGSAPGGGPLGIYHTADRLRQRPDCPGALAKGALPGSGGANGGGLPARRECDKIESDAEGVAQRLERLTVDQEVAGSIPVALPWAPVAQWDRALDFGSSGCAFESRRGRHVIGVGDSPHCFFVRGRAAEYALRVPHPLGGKSRRWPSRPRLPALDGSARC